MFVNTVDTKIKACNAFNAMFVNTVDTKIKCYCVLSRVSCLSTLLIQRSKHVMHLMLCLSTLSIQRSKHVMHLMLCLSTLSIQSSSGIRNILLKTEGIVDTVEMCASNSTASIPDELSSCWHCRSGIRIQSHKQVHPVFGHKQVHPVFEMFYSKQRELSTCNAFNAMFVDTVDLESGFKATNRFIRYSATNRFIRYSKCSTQNRENCRHVMHLMLCLSTLSIWNPDSKPQTGSSGIRPQTGSSGIRNVLLKTERIVDM